MGLTMTTRKQNVNKGRHTLPSCVILMKLAVFVTAQLDFFGK